MENAFVRGTFEFIGGTSPAIVAATELHNLELRTGCTLQTRPPTPPSYTELSHDKLFLTSHFLPLVGDACLVISSSEIQESFLLLDTSKREHLFGPTSLSHLLASWANRDWVARPIGVLSTPWTKVPGRWEYLDFNGPAILGKLVSDYSTWVAAVREIVTVKVATFGFPFSLPQARQQFLLEMEHTESLWTHLCETVGASGIDDLSSRERVWYTIRSLISSIENGGLISYFYNSDADYLPQAISSLHVLGLGEVIHLLKDISSLFPGEVPRSMEHRNAVIQEWSDDDPNQQALLDSIEARARSLLPILRESLSSYLGHTT